MIQALILLYATVGKASWTGWDGWNEPLWPSAPPPEFSWEGEPEREPKSPDSSTSCKEQIKDLKDLKVKHHQQQHDLENRELCDEFVKVGPLRCSGSDVIEFEAFSETDKDSHKACNDRFENTGAVMSACKKYCGHENIPILMGFPDFGLSGYQMTKLIFDLVEVRKSTIKKCSVARSAFQSIADATKDFVAALKVVRYAQLRFRSDIADKVEEVAETMASKETRKKIFKTLKKDKLNVFANLYTSLIDFSAGETEENIYLTNSLAKLMSASNTLNTLFNEQIEQFNTFFGPDCNRAFISLKKLESSADIFMKDLCQQTAGLCTWATLDGEAASRVGCACAENPVSKITFDSGGRRIFFGNRTRNKRHLLAGTTPVLDVCRAADEASKAEVIRMIQNTDRSIIDDYIKLITDAYPDASTCPPGACPTCTSSAPTTRYYGTWIILMVTVLITSN